MEGPLRFYGLPAFPALQIRNLTPTRRRTGSSVLCTIQMLHWLLEDKKSRCSSTGPATHWAACKPISDAAGSSRPEQLPPVLGRLEGEAGGGAERFLCCSHINYIPRPCRGLRGMSSSISTDL